MRVPLPPGPPHLLRWRRWANRVVAVRTLATTHFHPYRRVTTLQREQRANRWETELRETIQRVDQILRENNFEVYIQGMGDGGVAQAAAKEVDAYKLLHLLNRILLLSREAEGSSEAETTIWECPTFLSLLGFIKLKMPSFNIHEMFLLALCFSKIQFMPQMLMEPFLLTVQEGPYLQGFLEADVNKFFQFFFIVSSIKNVRVGEKADALFGTFAGNFVQVVWDFLAGVSGHVPCRQSRLSGRLPLDCCHLLCVALHNARVRNAPLMHRVATELVDHLNDHHRLDKQDQVDVAKKLINIYLAYASLRCENYHLYEKLNTFIYNLVEDLPLASCLTLLLSIATLKEQSGFNFPLCLLSSLEKRFSAKFYSLDVKDLLLLIYLLTYLNLHVANTDAYVCMLDHLFLFHKFEASLEEERVKLFQIYVSLRQSFQSGMLGGLDPEGATHTSGSCHEVDLHESSQRACRDKLQHVLRKVQANMQVEHEQNPPEYAQELDEEVNNLYALLHQMRGHPFFINNLRKNQVVLGYYLSHISFDLEQEENPKGESQKIAILFDADRSHFSDNSFDIYFNMKRNHLAKLNIKCLSIKLHQWRELSPEERRRFIGVELTRMYLPRATSSA
ncbi:unnamed protein product [Plasmodium vivax]|uniref:(malaria parasite P. vivax) hypothetical protein n=1 Tax=Plasmodium vivax TaxID=5855 RepID=A0A8S4HD19_PLAVI|nr:unnamed protein product [Plasmodium vivax]